MNIDEEVRKILHLAKFMALVELDEAYFDFFHLAVHKLIIDETETIFL